MSTEDFEIWPTWRNADMTEGRGPMVLDKLFLHQAHAVEYIDAQPGVMGVRRKWSQEKFGCWETRPVIVYATSFVAKEARKSEARRKALLKLTDEEQVLLGLKKA